MTTFTVWKFEDPDGAEHAASMLKSASGRRPGQDRRPRSRLLATGRAPADDLPQPMTIPSEGLAGGHCGASWAVRCSGFRSWPVSWGPALVR